MYVIYNQVNVLALFNNYQDIINCTSHFVYIPLNSYFIQIVLTGLTSIDETERRLLEKLITFDEMSTALSLMKNGMV